MKPWGRLIFVFVAYGLALLHTAVPHHHGEGRSGKLMFSHAGCVYDGGGGLLQRVISTDLGLGHLETFKKNTDTRLDFSSRASVVSTPFGLFSLLNAEASSVSRAITGYAEKFKRLLLLTSATHLRAPPFLS